MDVASATRHQRTVSLGRRVQVSRIIAKVGVANRTEASAYAAP
ncbi:MULTISPECIES: hypothetical protein [Nocardioides]|nr:MULTISPECIES: hypothetical protein [unclassified Nocardioides]